MCASSPKGHMWRFSFRKLTAIATFSQLRHNPLAETLSNFCAHGVVLFLNLTEGFPSCKTHRVSDFVPLLEFAISVPRDFGDLSYFQYLQHRSPFSLRGEDPGGDRPVNISREIMKKPEHWSMNTCPWTQRKISRCPSYPGSDTIGRSIRAIVNV